MSGDRRERLGFVEHTLLRTPEMGDQHQARALLECVAYAGERRAYARVVRDLAVFHGHVEVHADQDPLVGKVEVRHF
jgi:hypothetical protein